MRSLRLAAASGATPLPGHWIDFAKKVRLKRQARFALGKWNGGCRPFGYTSEAADLKPHAEEAPVLRQIFEMYLAHPSFASVRNRLKALGIRDRRSKVWRASALEWIIRNPIYAGDVHEHGEIRPGVHESLVSREMWDAAQRTLPTKTRLAEAKKYKRVYPLRGLITADEVLLESAIVAANASASDAAKPLVEKRAAVEKRLAEVRAKEANLASAIASGGSFEALKRALASEQANRHLLETERDGLKRQIDALAGDPIDPARVRRLLGDFRLLYEAATDVERAELLRLLIARIEFHGKNANVVVAFRDDVKLTAPIRSYAVKWLSALGSNHGLTAKAHPRSALSLAVFSRP